MHTHADLESTGVARGLLKETIAHRVRQAILDGRLQPGQKIVEGRWAREYGVAQISIREGLNILVAQGFVTKGHGRSARVLNLDDSDIINIYRVRGALEGLAARLVVENNLDASDLESAFEKMKRAVHGGDLRTTVECVQRFHMLLLEKPGNPVLKEHGRRLLVPLYAFTQIKAAAKGLDTRPWEQQLARHRLIVDVIREGNASVAEQTVIHVINQFLEAALVVWAR